MEDKEQKDYYIDKHGFFVFTRKFLLRRGFCCKNGCRHCPYPRGEKEAQNEEKVAK